jgi:hypothetical protein
MDLPFPWPFGVMPSDERPPYRSRPGINLLRYGATTTVDGQTIAALKKVSTKLGWDAAKARRSVGGDRDQPIVGPRVIGWEVDREDGLFFMGRHFVAGTKPSSSVHFYQEDVERIEGAIRDARRSADIVVFALHDQSMLGGAPEMKKFAHGIIDAGADVYVNTVGLHGGIEVYHDGLILYGQPSLWLQNEHVPHVPSSAMSLMDLPERASAADYLDKREAAFNATEAAQPKWTSPGIRSARGTAVHVAVFDAGGRIEEVVVQPLEVVPHPRQRSGMPLMPEPGSPVTDEVLGLAARKCAQLGTDLTRDPSTGTGRVIIR